MAAELVARSCLGVRAGTRMCARADVAIDATKVVLSVLRGVQAELSM
jgi:hypothetical protein